MDQNKTFIWKLQKALSNRDVTTAKRILKGGLDINALYWGGLGCIHEAIRSDDLAMVQMLIKAGADINLETTEGLTPLHYACRSGNNAIIDVLLDAKCKVNVQAKDGRTPLHIAVWKNLIQVRKLLCHGADLNLKDSDGWTVLHSAAHNGNHEAMKLLILKGANMSIAAKDGKTAMSLSVVRSSMKCVNLLLFHGAGTIQDINNLSFKSCKSEQLKSTEKIRVFLDTKNKNSVGYSPHILSLAEACRVVIRLALLEASGGRCIVARIDALDIPPILKNYLKLTDMFEDYDFDRTISAL